MNKYQILSYIRDELLSDPYIDADFAWKTFEIAENNGDMESLYNRYMISSEEEKIFIINLMEDLLKVYE